MKKLLFSERTHPRYNYGFSSIMAMLFVTLFSILALSFTAVTAVNVKVSQNQYDISCAQSAAESGLEYARYLVKTYVPPQSAYSPRNDVTEAEAEDTFGYFAQHVQDLLGYSNVAWDSSNLTLRVPAHGTLALSAVGSTAKFSLLFTFLPGDATQLNQMVVTSSGSEGDIAKKVTLAFPIKKDNRVLKYAIASRGRIWLTGDSTIDGDLFSNWDNLARSPFNMTADSRINGTINTVLTKQQCIDASWQLETLDENGDPVYDSDGNKVYSPEDEIQGYCEGINYDQPYENMPGMDINDYDTDDYYAKTTQLPKSNITRVEYFPHKPGDYTKPKYSWSRKLYRKVYENQHFTNKRLPPNKNALFKNCTFDGILYIDCAKSGSGYYNNVRFENCTFNGPIVTDTPKVFKWRENCLYFTGTETFNNTTMKEATILAPEFNVNLGNTDPVDGDTNKLTGAIVGGIVDIRGNAEIHGTVISMCDTTQWTSGYVTNIGATLGDGGSETTELGDVGTIHITPNPENFLPNGIKTPIVIAFDGSSYVEN